MSLNINDKKKTVITVQEIFDIEKFENGQMPFKPGYMGILLSIVMNLKKDPTEKATNDDFTTIMEQYHKLVVEFITLPCEYAKDKTFTEENISDLLTHSTTELQKFFPNFRALSIQK